jgi:hypothetical protein
MLLQSQHFKISSVDKAQDCHETGGDCHMDSQLADNLDEKREETKKSSVTNDSVIANAGRKASTSKKQTGRVFVLSNNGNPLMPCNRARARSLLKSGKAVIHRYFPFVIRLKERKTRVTQPVALKLDPGASTTGAALVRLDNKNPQKQHVLFTLELQHRKNTIRDNLKQRSSFRRSRRSRNLKYRAPRFNNRTKPEGWLPPSLRHLIETNQSWVHRFQRWTPLTNLAMESVKFDTQLLENPDISGIEYQQGNLAGAEVREYVLLRGNHTCAYCDAQNVPLNLDHIIPKAKGGSNRVSNLVPACIKCNSTKSDTLVEIFVKDKTRLNKILAQTKKSLAGTAAVNSSRPALEKMLVSTGLPVETATGGLTKWNRKQLGMDKTHANDAACVGKVFSLSGKTIQPLLVKCMGRGSHKRTHLDKFGFPRGYLTREKSHFGFQTGDIVKADVTKGKHKGFHFGRITIRTTGSFDIQTKTKTKKTQGIPHKCCKKIQNADGYHYNYYN